MYFLLGAGIAFALGHHFYYLSLREKPAVDQQGMLRYGTVLAFLSKAFLINAVILAFRQRVLMMIRRKMLTLGTLDSLFAASEDLTALFNRGAWKSAKLAMCLAIFAWLTPLIVIFTTVTLSVEPLTKRQETMCPEIRTLNFSHEEIVDFRSAPRVDGYISLSVSYWNTTAPGDNINETNPNEFDYWDNTSQQFKQIAFKTAYLQQTVMRRNASDEICGKGWNCSFEVSFVGPGYKCTQLASGINDQVKDLGSLKVPFDTKDLLPHGNKSYYAITDEADYAIRQMDVHKGGRPIAPPPYPANLGAFRTEPILWIGYADVKNRSKIQPQTRATDGWYEAYTPKIFGCEHYETNYTVVFNYTGSVQSHNVTKREFLRKVIDTTYTPDEIDSETGTWDNNTATPEKNYVFPQDVANYRRTAAYHSIGKQLRDILSGTIEMPHYVSGTRATETRLIDRLNYLPVEHFQHELQKFYEEILLSFLSDPQFIVVSWASDPSKYSGNAQGGNNSKYPCERVQTTNCYTYDKVQLLTVYAVSISLAIVAVVFGIAAIKEDTMMQNLSFSAIIAATRGNSLDKLKWEAENDVSKARIGYGLLSGLGERRYAFGVEGDVYQEQTRTLARSPAIQMMDWGENAAKRVGTVVFNRSPGT